MPMVRGEWDFSLAKAAQFRVTPHIRTLEMDLVWVVAHYLFHFPRWPHLINTLSLRFAVLFNWH